MVSQKLKSCIYDIPVSQHLWHCRVSVCKYMDVQRNNSFVVTVNLRWHALMRLRRGLSASGLYSALPVFSEQKI